MSHGEILRHCGERKVVRAHGERNELVWFGLCAAFELSKVTSSTAKRFNVNGSVTLARLSKN